MKVYFAGSIRGDSGRRYRWALNMSWLTLKHMARKYIFSTDQGKRSFLLCLPEMNDSTYIAIRMNPRYWRR